MNFLGMGPLEIILILIIAFIFLGPERMVDAAKMLGKMVGEARNIASEVPRVVVEDDDLKIVSDGKATSLTGQDAPKTPPPAAARAESETAAQSDGDDGPVAFSRQSAPEEARTGESRDSTER